MFKYNSNTKIITTDDIVIGSDNTALGNSLTDAITQNSQAIEELKANVKWLSMHGGSGSGGSGGGSTDPTAQPSTFILTASYTNLSGDTITDQEVTDGGYILAAKDIRISFKVTKTTISATNINYIVTVNDASGKSWASGKLDTDTNTYNFSITPSENIFNITVTVPGTKPKYARSQTFSIYVKIVDIDQGIYDISDPERITIATDRLNATTLQSNNYELRNNVSACHSSFEVTSVKTYIQDTEIDMPTTSSTITGDALKGYFKAYGIYTVKYTYELRNLEDNNITATTTSVTYVYKDNNKIFILCTGTLDNSIYNSSQVDSTPITYSSNNVIVTYKIYGKSTDVSSDTYNVSIYEDNALKISDRATQINKSDGYTIVNTNTSDTVKEKILTFKADGETFTYYIYLETAVDNLFILKTRRQNGEEQYCYNAIHSDTELSIDSDQTMEFPSKVERSIVQTDGSRLPVWVFSKERQLQIKKVTPLSTVGSKNITSLKSFITSESATQDVDADTDGLLCIGWQNKVTASTQVLFTITSADGIKSIKVYNDKIAYDKNTEGNYTRTCIPKDDEFHLISFYFKHAYKSASANESTSSFVIYIDGVQETVPLDTGIIMKAGVTLTIPAGSSCYNFFGFTSFNRGIGEEGINKYPEDLQPVIQRYLEDYDPIIPAHYYAQYTQTFSSVVKYQYSPLSDAMYTLFSRDNKGWINLLRGNNAPDLKKFIDVTDVEYLSKLAGNIPMYKIVPTKEQGIEAGQPNLNKFIYNTMTSYDEKSAAATTATCKCKLYVYKDSQWQEFISDTNTDNFNGFQVKYQGSSTMLYSVKNFEISTVSYTDTNLARTTEYYFSPDSEHFPYLEQSYNLKADMVDSSTSTNNVIGNVVNEYLTSPFNQNNVEYKCCLSGIPILLFMGNEISGGEQNEFFLGIYNWNLNRDSWQHLGYQKINDSVERHTDKNTGATYCAIIDPATQLTTRNFRVAEIQDNNALFDFSQYDDGLLQDQMLGDFKVGDPVKNTISESYTTDFSTFISDFSNYVKAKIVDKAFIPSDYADVTPYTKVTLTGTYYIMTKGNYEKLSLDGSEDIYELSSFIKATAYHDYKQMDDGRNVAIVGNSGYQFKELFVKEGTTYTPYTDSSNTSLRFLIKQKVTTSYSEETTRNIMQIESAVKYYMICMAFAMVDSIQKNLNIKTAEWSDTGKVTWVPAFYDMDTALGLTNSGGDTNFKAFSNYIEGTTIIGDYAPLYTSNWFDIPSSYLFLFAKYDELFQEKTTDEGSNFSYNIPYVQWKILRGVYGETMAGYGILQNADYFCDNYLDKHLSSVHPLLMNLNYLYKYFSLTKNTGGSNGDTEEKRFHGTMKAYRRQWLDKRLHFLDAMFGINNSQLIGNTNISIVTSIESAFSSQDIYIQQSMYPQFTKGFTGTIKVDVEGPAYTPIIFKTTTNHYQLYILDSQGKATISAQISTSTAIGFYGSKVLTYVSDHGQFLQCETSSYNTIENDQISEVTIQSTDSTNPKSVSLNLTKIPSCKKISLSSTSNIFKDFIVQGDQDGNYVLEEVTIKGITAENVTFKNCHINKLTLANTFTVTSTYTFENVTIGSYTEASTMKIKELTIVNSTFEENDTLTFTSNIEDSSYTINNIKFKDNLTVNYKAKSISISNLTSQTYKDNAVDAIHNAKDGHAIFRNNYLYYCTPSDSTLTIKNTIKVNAFYMNSIAHNDISSLNNGVSINSHITTIYINGEDTWAFYSFPACKALTSCTHRQGTVKLWDYGVAWSKINSIGTRFSFKIGSGAYAFYNCISAFNNNCINELNNVYWEAYEGNYKDIYLLNLSFVHALPAHSSSKETGHACDFAYNYYTLIKTLYSHDINNIQLRGAFIKNHFSGNVENSAGIYSVGTSVWGTRNLGTRDQYVEMLKLIFRHGEYTDGIFLRTAFNVLPAELGGTLTRYHSHLGSDSSGSILYVESGALTSCTHFYSQHDDEGLDLSYYHYNWSGQHVFFINSAWQRTSVIFYDEMPIVEYINANIESTSDYPVSFEKGNSSKLKQLVAIFGWQSSVPYIRNGEKYLDNIPEGLKSEGGAYEFTGEGWDGTLNDYNVNIYKMLFEETSKNSSGIKLKSNAAAILPNAIVWDHDGFGFAKQCTWTEFKKILLWLQTDEAKAAFNGTIGKMFHDCYVSGVPTNRPDVKEAFKGALYGYTVTYRTFQSLHLMDSTGIRRPADFTDIFKDKETGVTTPVTGLAATFYDNYLYQWDDYSRETNPLGITPKSTSYMPWAFRQGTYTQTRENSNALWASDNDISICEYGASAAYSDEPILPPHFFDFVAPNTTYSGGVMNRNGFQGKSSAYYMFYGCTNLRGTLPETDTLDLSNLGAVGDTTWCFYSWIVDPVMVSGKTYRIFPDWFCKLTMRDRFNVYIPVPPKSTSESVSPYTLCLFNDATKSFPAWDYLPRIIAARPSSNSIAGTMSKYLLKLDTKDTTCIHTVGDAVRCCVRDDIGYTLALVYPFVDNLGTNSPIIDSCYDSGIYKSQNNRNLMFRSNYNSIATNDAKYYSDGILSSYS